MKDTKILILRIKERFRRDPKTTWGKNQLIEALDEIDDLYHGENK